MYVCMYIRMYVCRNTNEASNRDLKVGEMYLLDSGAQVCIYAYTYMHIYTPESDSSTAMNDTIFDRTSDFTRTMFLRVPGNVILVLKRMTFVFDGTSDCFFPGTAYTYIHTCIHAYLFCSM